MILALGAGCPPQKKERPRPAVVKKAEKAEKAKEALPAEAPAKAAAAPQALPDTVPPKAGEPTKDPGSAYDPAQDPKNLGGWSFQGKRAPTDAADARKRPFSIEALYKVITVGHPRWSPDSKRILFVATRHNLKAGKSNSDIYLMDAGGAHLRRMTRNPASDSSPCWAPDGESFIFVSTRKQGAQIWRMAADGGEPEQLTKISTGVDAPTYSPDGKLIAFSSRVFPAHGADDAKNKALLDDIKKSPIKAHIADDLLYRHWTFYKDGRRSHVLVLEPATSKLIDVTPGDFDSPAFGLGHAGLAFSPDSRELCFVSNREPGSARAWTTNKDLLVVPARGGKAINLTAQNKAFDGHPVYSPDGKYIAFLRQQVAGYESDRFVLALYERRTGKVRLISEGFDNWVRDFAWAPDSKSIIFKGAVKARFPLFRLDLATNKISRLAIPSVRDFHLSRAGRLTFTYSAVDAPHEVFSAGPGGEQARRLTHFNQQVKEQVDLRPAEERWIKGADNKEVHTFIIKPHGFSPKKRYPLIINVHGGPQYQWADAFRGDWQVYSGSGYVTAFFNPHGSIGYGQAYTAAISRDWGGKVYEDVMAVTEALAKLPYVDNTRVGAMGWSYGGYMMNWILGHTDRFKALVSMMSVYDLPSMFGATEELWFPEWDLGGKPWTAADAYRKWSPSTHAAKFKTPTLVISGQKDFRVPYTQSLQLYTALRRQGVPARLVLFRDDGHWPNWVKSMPLYYAAHLDWFHRYLGGAPPPYDIVKMTQGRAW